MHFLPLFPTYPQSNTPLPLLLPCFQQELYSFLPNPFWEAMSSTGAWGQQVTASVYTSLLPLLFPFSCPYAPA